MRIARVLWDGQPVWAEIAGDVLHALEGPGSPVRTGTLGSLSAATLLAPIEPTAKIIGLLDNFDGQKGRKGPGLFIKPATTVVAPGGPIRWPLGMEALNFESELAVVIGKTAKHVSAADARDHVLGYTVSNDVTSFAVLEEDGFSSISSRFKLYDDFFPLGPWIETDVRPEELRLRAYLNDEIKQDAALADMAFAVPEVIAWISAVMTLHPGDVISMGTPPGFVPMARGDVIRCEIDGIGTLENTLV